MTYSSLTKEDKQRILKALEEDREFRYALMGLLGFREVLDRITRLEERQQKLEERFARLEERFAELAERQQRLEERVHGLEERFIRLEERQQRLEEELISLRRVVEYARRDVGALTEAMYSRMVWEDIREEVTARGGRVVSRRRNARVNGYDVDLIIEAEESVYVVEVKIQPDHHDVNELLEKSRAVERVTGKKAIPVLAGTWVGREVRDYCREKGVTVIEY